ncbi:MAG: hypothetical protein WD738_11530 [Pirellulales bacterium]
MDSPTVSCAGPAAFFRGEYIFRTLNGTMAVISGLVPSAIAAAVAVYISTMGEDLLSDFVSAIFALVALIFGALGLWTLWSWIRNRRVPVEINEEGIVCGSRFWPWGRVRSFAGMRYDNGVCLEFTPCRRGVWGGGTLPTTPLLTDQQYVELARKLDQCISARFPHVIVAMVPEDATADP